MILILDYDMGNVGAVKNILNRIGEKNVLISRDEKDILKADKLIIPGVGAFDSGMRNLQKYQLINPINYFAKEQKKPVLGICLGMQILGRSSEEGVEQGLELIPFATYRFKLEQPYRIPHMGWNYVEFANPGNPILRGIAGKQRYYFVHSYYAKCDNPKDILMTSYYGHSFTAAVAKDNVYGVQFHPEKSHQYGMKLLKNYVEEC